MLEKTFVENNSIEKILAIVSVGPTQPHPTEQPRTFIVPCTVKVKRDGQIKVYTLTK